MKLYAKDNKLYFDYEGKQSELFSYDDFAFKYLGGGLREFVPSGNAEYDYYLLNLVEINCSHVGVKICSSAEEVISGYKTAAQAERQKRLAAEAERAKEEAARAERERKASRWQLIQKHGCQGCSKLSKVGDDDYICKHTGQSLEVKNNPCFYNGMYYLFNYVPCPCEGCLYKFEEEKNELTKTDKYSA